MIGLAAVLIPLFGLATGGLRPADYSAHLVEEAKGTIRSAEQVTPEMIPDGLHYVILSKDHLEAVGGNMSPSETEKARKAMEGTLINQFGNHVFTSIERPGEYCVIHYRMAAQFSNPYLRQLIPFPEIVYIVLVFISFLVAFYTNLRSFSKFMKHELRKLKVITEKIKEEELDFAAQAASIIEFQEVTDSLDSLRTALKQSIEAGLEQEKNKQEQISALAHDIKIPMTIIRGNTELLSLSSRDETQSEFTQEIIAASLQVEQYIKLLVQMSQSDEMLKKQVQRAEIEDFLAELQKDTHSLISTKDISFVLDNRIPPQVAWEIDAHLLQRALMNIIMNGMEFTPAGHAITLTAYLEHHAACFEIVDEGPGFTEEAIRRGKEMFYSGDKSRSNTGHYGIGLAFANKVIQIHKGTLQLQNDENTGGGHVRITVPCLLW